jgi:hypothetical protein
MATSGYVQGHNFRLFIGTTGVGHAESCSFKISIDKKELSDKDVDPGAITPGAVAITLGKKRISLQVTGFVVDSENGTLAATGGYRTHLNNALNGTKVAFMFTTNVTGDTKVTGEGYITEFGGDGADGSEAKYSFTVDGTGTFAAGVV